MKFYLLFVYQHHSKKYNEDQDYKQYNLVVKDFLLQYFPDIFHQNEHELFSLEFVHHQDQSNKQNYLNKIKNFNENFLIK